MRAPLASVIVPARNEAAWISGCIDAIAAQSCGSDRLQVIVVDGASTDGTLGFAEDALARHQFALAMVVSNPAGTTPSNLNRGLDEVTAPYVARVDARSRIPSHYIELVVATLSERHDVVATGGRQKADAAGPGILGRGIARALRNPYATGLARYRRSRTSGATDTVYLGAFRTAELKAEGGWDERYLTNQDYELNRRLAARGSVWYDSRLEVTYIPRDSLAKLWNQYRRFGRWKAAVWLETRGGIAARHFILISIPLLAGLGTAMAVRFWGWLSTVIAAVVVTAALDVSAREPGPLMERIVAIPATAVIASAWWLGILEQIGRRALGQRLIDPAPVNV